LRGARCEDRYRRGRVSSAPPQRGVSEISRYHREQRVPRPRRAFDPRQLRDAQDGADPPVAGQAAALPSPLHADRRVLAEPRGGLVCLAHRETVTSRCAPQHARAGDRDQTLPHDHQREPEAVRVDQDRRPDPRSGGYVLSTDFGLGTLAEEVKKAYRFEEALAQATNSEDFALKARDISSTSDSPWDDFDKEDGKANGEEPIKVERS